MSVHLFSNELDEGGSPGIGPFFVTYDLCHLGPYTSSTPYRLLDFGVPASKWKVDSPQQRHRLLKPLFFQTIGKKVVGSLYLSFSLMIWSFMGS